MTITPTRSTAETGLNRLRDNSRLMRLCVAKLFLLEWHYRVRCVRHGVPEGVRISMDPQIDLVIENMLIQEEVSTLIKTQVEACFAKA